MKKMEAQGSEMTEQEDTKGPTPGSELLIELPSPGEYLPR